MKKVAVTVAVLALGLAACAKNNANNVAGNDMGTENAATADMNAATNETNAASNALDEASNNLAAASNAVDNAASATNNAASNK
jgi:hypothetical protein